MREGRLVLVLFLGMVMHASSSFNVTYESVATNTSTTTTTFLGGTSASSFLFAVGNTVLHFSKSSQWIVNSKGLPYPQLNTVPLSFSLVPSQPSPTIAVVLPIKGDRKPDSKVYLYQLGSTSTWASLTSGDTINTKNVKILASSKLILVKADLLLLIYYLNTPSLIKLPGFRCTSTLFAAFGSSVAFLSDSALTIADCNSSSCTTTVLNSAASSLSSISMNQNYVFAKISNNVLMYKRGTILSTVISPVHSSTTFGSNMSISEDGNFLMIFDSNLDEINIYYYNSTSWNFNINIQQNTSFTYTSGAIYQTNSGYVVFAHAVPSQAANTYIAMFTVNCGTNSNGINCTRCSCVNGLCDNSMWNNTKTCRYCRGNFYGANCQNTCTCLNGYCSTGLNGTGQCTSCFAGNGSVTGWYGSNCASPCSCVNGVCKAGISGDGKCSLCYANYYNYNCSKGCHCGNYSCWSGINGNGTCLNCNSTQFGPYCDNCYCQHGVCSSGINGNGYCLSCSLKYYGKNCSKVSTCTHGNPNSGIYGDGKCSSCFPGYYGPNCDKVCSCSVSQGTCDPVTGLCTNCTNSLVFGLYCNQSCTCKNGICSSGIYGNGKCLSCTSTRHFNSDCSEACTCLNGTCDSGINGTGKCLSCEINFAGTNCDLPCDCPFGTCNGDIKGDGSCLTCNAGYYGESCLPCTCANGECMDGINGTGFCSSCNTNYYGPNCDLLCHCNLTNTLCESSPSNTIGCTSECVLGTHDCDQRCYYRKSSTTWKCGCNDGYHLNNNNKCIVCPPDFICKDNVVIIQGTNTVLNQSIGTDVKIISGLVVVNSIQILGNVSVINSTTKVSGNTVISGDINSKDSHIIITDSGILIVKGDITLNNGSISMSNDTFVNVSGCLKTNNTTLSLQVPANTDTIKVLKTSEKCTKLNPFSTIQYNNPSSCGSTTLKDTSSDNTLIFSVSHNESSCDNFPIWLIATIAIGGFILLVLVALVIVNKSAKLRTILFPFRRETPYKAA